MYYRGCIYCFGEFKHGLHEKEVKHLFKSIFDKKWRSQYNKFGKFMFGQTVAVSEVTGDPLYYHCDVARFLENNNEK